MEGRHRRPPHQRRRRAAEETRGRCRPGLGEDPRWQKRGGRTRRRQQPAHRVRAPAAGRRLAERRATDPAAGRQGDLLHRGAGARQPAQAPGGGRRRLHRPGAGYRLPQARRRGGGGGSATAHPAGLRRRTDQAGGPGLAQAGRRAVPRAQPAGPERERRAGPRRRRRGARDRRRPGTGGGRPQAAQQAGTWKAWAWT